MCLANGSNETRVAGYKQVNSTDVFLCPTTAARIIIIIIIQFLNMYRNLFTFKLISKRLKNSYKKNVMLFCDYTS